MSYALTYFWRYPMFMRLTSSPHLFLLLFSIPFIRLPPEMLNARVVTLWGRDQSLQECHVA